MNQIEIRALPGIPLIEEGADLAELTLAALAGMGVVLQDRDVLVYTSKIVSKAEGRIRRLSEVRPSPAAREIARVCEKDPRLVALILSESNQVVRIRPGLLVVEHLRGFICANAGIDHSNASADEDVVLLLPADPDASAARLRQALVEATGAEIAVILNDSHGRAWRLGTVGVAIGVAGLLPVSDRRGAPDLFGHPLHITQLGTADELAAAASLLQGGANEGAPIVHIRGANYHPGPGRLRDMLRPRQADMFR